MSVKILLVFTNIFHTKNSILFKSYWSEVAHSHNANSIFFLFPDRQKQNRKLVLLFSIFSSQIVSWLTFLMLVIKWRILLQTTKVVTKLNFEKIRVWSKRK